VLGGEELDMSDGVDPVIVEEEVAGGAAAALTSQPAEPLPVLDRAGQQQLAEQLVARAQGTDLAGGTVCWRS
jgi:hypothetical protein